MAFAVACSTSAHGSTCAFERDTENAMIGRDLEKENNISQKRFYCTVENKLHKVIIGMLRKEKDYKRRKPR